MRSIDDAMTALSVANSREQRVDAIKQLTLACLSELYTFQSPCIGFPGALEVLRIGGRIARQGWNGKGMWLVLVDIYEVVDTRSEVDSFGAGELLPWIGMKTADGKFVPWLASQTDILADDWVVLS